MREGDIEIERSRRASRCPYCHDDLDAKAPQRLCGGCHAVFHPECWAESGADCSTCGWSGPAESTQPAPAKSTQPAAAKLAPVESTKPAPAESTKPSLRLAERSRERSDSLSALTWVLYTQAVGLGLATCLAAVQAYYAVTAGGLALGASIPFVLGTGALEKRPGLGVLISLLNLLVGLVGAAMVDGLNIRKRRPSLLLFGLGLAYLLLTIRLARHAAKPRPD